MSESIHEIERKGDEERLKVLTQKQQEIQKKLDLETDATVKFKYGEELRELDRKIWELKQKLGYITDYNPIWTPFFESHLLRDDVGPSITVNCDRKKHYLEGLLKHFREYFSAKGQSPKNLFYCIVGCPMQRPVSIAKRLIYDIERQDTVLRVVGTERPEEIIVVSLELGFDPEKTWELLWEDLRKRLAVSEQPAASLQDLAEQSVGKSYIALVCRLNVQHWLPDTIEYLRHIASQFCGMPEVCRKYLFLLAIELPHIHDLNHNKYSRDLKQIQTLCSKLDKEDGLSAACFSLLPPVHRDDIELWCTDVFKGEKKRAFEEILLRLRKNLPSDIENFDMEAVETIQEAAWTHHIRPQPNLF